MKFHKVFTLDVVVCERLKEEENASALVNELLIEYYATIYGKKSILEQKKAIFDQLKKKKNQLSRELRALSTVEDLGIDQKAVRWCKGHEKEPLTSETFEYIKGRQLCMESKALKQGWKIIIRNQHAFQKI